MPRDEHDREDLLREATALVERVELALPGEAEHVVAGFRRDGGLSLFFGQDPVYQFNSRRQLRRAYVAGLLYKADGGRLATLERRRETYRVVLLRRDLTDDETAAFVARLSERLAALLAALIAGDFRVVGRQPPHTDVAARLRGSMESLPLPPTIADAPRAR